MAGIESPSTGVGLEIDTAFKAARASLRPMDGLSWMLVAGRSGALTGATANSALFSFRNLSANPVIVRRVGIGFVCTTAFTAAQELAWGLKVARAFTASDTGGTQIALTGNNCKARTSLALPSSTDCRISSSGALTAGTKVLDTNDLGVAGAYAGAVGASVMANNNLLSPETGAYPLVLAQNEGFNIMNLVAMGAGGVGTIYVNVELVEAAAY